jgi:hypothetical protein
MDRVGVLRTGNLDREVKGAQHAMKLSKKSENRGARLLVTTKRGQCTRRKMET